jgi:type I restriction enzyme M protein
MAQFASPVSRKKEGSDRLGRYYTKTDIGGLLIEQMVGLSPNRVLDLGAGAGSLSRAALKQWADVELLTVDVDANARSYLKNLLKASGGLKHNHIQADALSSKLPKLISAKADYIDAAVCNPPFITPKWRKGFAQILEDAGFSGCLPVLSDVNAALLFLAQNLRLLSARATLGIILPDSLVSATKYRLFRKELLQRYMVHKAIRLPRHSFQSTDAQAYIVVISKGSATNQRIPLQKFDADHDVSSELLVNMNDAIDRLDFDYHAHRLQWLPQKTMQVSLRSIVEDIKRGSFSSAEARLARFPVLHTTDIAHSSIGTWCNLERFGHQLNQYGIERNVICAEPGDILVARVGRNLEQKIIGISHGFPILTDCVYKIKVPKQLQKNVLMQLSCPQGQAWLASRAYGVSAKQLTKADLLAFPMLL